ncbi:MAG: YbaK/EbsC family protein [Candidatus Promineifilaceae bacterium]|nr:aminoacyl-tRNA deacylase [Chloroflexota bacterium]
MMVIKKTLAMKVLEGKKIPYEVVTYPNTERDALQVAAALGVPPEQVYKTLVVVRAKGKPFLTIIAAPQQLNLKKMAKVVGEKKLDMATHKEAEQLTKLQVGGISALALLNKGFVIVLDQSAQAHEYIYVSAGEKGINLKVPVTGLLDITEAQVLDVADWGEE